MSTSVLDWRRDAAGADADQINADSGSRTSAKQIAAAKAAGAQDAGISSTPSFEIGPTGGDLTALDVSRLETSAFEDAIDQQLASAQK